MIFVLTFGQILPSNGACKVIKLCRGKSRRSCGYHRRILCLWQHGCQKTIACSPCTVQEKLSLHCLCLNATQKTIKGVKSLPGLPKNTLTSSVLTILAVILGMKKLGVKSW